MKAPDFAYLRPASVPAALDALARHGDDAVVLAGGQSLVAMLNLRVAQARVLVDINRIPGLSGIEDRGGTVAIGALTRYAALQASPLVREHLPLMAEALPHVAHEAVRNRGTLGGSLALADPSAEMPACCLALGAHAVVDGPGGRREVAMADWFEGLYETALQPGELLLEIRIPKQRPGTVVRFTELSRRRGDFAVAGVALTARPDNGVVRDPRVALLGVDDRPVLAHDVMSLLAGTRLDALSDVDLAAAVVSDTDPLDDPVYPVAYRRQVVKVLLERTLNSMTESA